MVLENIPGMAIAGQIERGLHLDHFVTQRLSNQLVKGFLAVASDTIHLNASQGDILIEDCRFGASGDDHINIKANYWRVTNIDIPTRTVSVQPAGRSASLDIWGRRGHSVVFIDSSLKVLGETTLSKNSISDPKKQHRLILEEIPAGLAAGSLVANRTTSGGRLVIRNNKFGPTRAQGILVQTQHVLIENNSFDGIAGPAIQVKFAPKDWYESILPKNILIRENRFGHVAFA